MLMCMSRLKNSDVAVIKANFHKIYLMPIANIQELSTIDWWPRGKDKSRILNHYISQLYRNLLAEFRKSEKYGLFTMVDSTASSSITVSLHIQSWEMAHDTLVVKFLLDTYYPATGKLISVTVNSFGVVPPLDTNAVPVYDTLQVLGVTFADLVRHFPYTSVVTPFCDTVNSQDTE